MATKRQKAAARSNITSAQRASHRGAAPKRGNELRERDRTKLGADRFAFPAERKEPLTDASHVRNAIARFDQVEGVSDAERDRAWRRIRAAAKRHGVEIEVRGWRRLMAGRKS
ncbi:MAG: DUF6582 domain-containing protein [Candidatus Dormiibacterota bacterium]